jgi:alpha-1,2-mannosyltransferase
VPVRRNRSRRPGRAVPQSRSGGTPTWTPRGVAVLALLAAPLLAFQVGVADLDVYRHGGSAVLHGTSLYSPSFGAHTRAHLPFTYPPFAAVAAVLLVPLPEVVDSWIWAAATIGMLAWCVSRSFDSWLTNNRVQADLLLACLTGLFLYTRPVFDHLGDGQVDILLMTMCLADVLIDRPRWPRGALVGVATAIKLVPGVFIPFLWLTGRRRTALIATGTFVGCELLAGAIAPSSSKDYWTRLVYETNRPGSNISFKNQSLRGLVLRLAPAPDHTWLLLFALVIVAGLALHRAVRAWSRGHAVAGAALIGLLGVLISPVSWIHSTVWVIPAVGVLVGRAANRRRIAAAGLATLALVAALPYIPNEVSGLPSPLAQLLRASFGLLCVALVTALPTTSQPLPLDIALKRSAEPG